MTTTDRRGSSTQRGYDYRWQQARLVYLAENPLCVRCLERGKVVQATVVDHIVPHKGDQDLFWDRSNWQSLCETDHNVKTATEDSGRAPKPRGADVTGMPTDSGHHWNK